MTDYNPAEIDGDDTSLKGATDGTPIGNTGDRLHVDSTGIVVSTGELDDYIAQGVVYEHRDVHTIGNNQTFTYLIIMPNLTETFLEFDITTQGESNVYLYEAPTISANGTAESLFNRNRNSTNTSTILLYEEPTVSANGTELEHTKIGAGGGGKQGAGGSSDRYILKANTKYLLSCTSQASANNATFSIQLKEG